VRPGTLEMLADIGFNRSSFDVQGILSDQSLPLQDVERCKLESMGLSYE
jgi:hypothetical protein